MDGSIGTNALKIADANKDGKVTFAELKELSWFDWIRIAVSIGTSALSALEINHILRLWG